MAFPYLYASATGALKQYFNYTFWIAEHMSAFGWGVAPMPRTHGDRAQDVAYLNGKTITLRGFVGAGYSATGSMPFGWVLTPQVNSTLSSGIDADDVIIPVTSGTGFASSGRVIIESEVIYYTGRSGNNLLNAWRGMEGTTAATHSSAVAVTAPSIEAQYFDQLRGIIDFLHQHSRGILDYRNGWIQYVLFESLKDVQVEGWPDTRAVEVVFRVEDPMAYSLHKALGIPDASSAHLLNFMINGKADSRHYRMRIRSSRPAEITVKIDNGTDPPMTLIVPASYDTPLVLNGFQRVLYQTPAGLSPSLAPTTAWSRYVPGSVMPFLRPGPNTWAFSDVAGDSDITMDDFIFTTLSAGINAAVTNIPLTSAAEFPAAGSITIGTEYITYTGKSTNTLTGATRGAGGTTAASHTSGTTVHNAAKLLQIEVIAHGADWMADSFRVPQNLPPGEYDLALYDLDVYGA